MSYEMKKMWSKKIGKKKFKKLIMDNFGHFYQRDAAAHYKTTKQSINNIINLENRQKPTPKMAKDIGLEWNEGCYTQIPGCEVYDEDEQED